MVFVIGQGETTQHPHFIPPYMIKQAVAIDSITMVMMIITATDEIGARVVQV